ncbi:MAG: cysteine desulfurase [Gammaproteobacteria bacterium]|nr:MAG: cysteine desulfurase [Gammaproteobacteria bacterium]
MFGNASSRQHKHGVQADKAIEHARQQVATSLECSPKDLIFTSGATEANNLAIKGIVYGGDGGGRHLITSMAEHKSVLDTFKHLEQNGFAVTYLRPDAHGRFTIEQVRRALKPETILVSLMHVNNETGTVEDVGGIATMLAEQDVLFHVDATQGVGKLPINLSTSPISLLSLSAHKFYGPKGIGCLFIKNRSKTKLAPLFHGGDQEHGLRPGTYATHQIVGLGEAIELADELRDHAYEEAVHLRQQFLAVVKQLDGLCLNGDQDNMLPNIINLSFAGVDSETLLTTLRNEISFASGSACTSGALGVSHVLQSMGVAQDVAYGAIRISFGRYTTADEIQFAAESICDEVKRIRGS